MQEREPGPGPERRTRRRGDDLVRAIHAAVLRQVAEVGIGGLTMEGIAKEAATAKTSLYRRWSSPRELLLDALHEAHPQEVPSPGANDLRGDLIRALTQLVAWMTTPAAAAVVALLMERQRHPDLVAALYTRVFEPRGGTFTSTVLRHYAAQGEIDPALLTPVVMDIGEALVLKYSTDNDHLPYEQVLADIVDQAILPAVGIGPPGRRTAGRG
ncbi:TetR/AcrR family transcriptional regulator [Micromonospora sp. WMMD1102]|uniref:TetR/AcrR family transcriptional regulator n=1 Tax=Micromonospora sp. WMMD1102 TaxID=3016105 RepID=UPI0024150F4C|nr:TetR/AcrR family transcriptional regulator [Micromonospora sp. WMMD1102]MDG4785366.1 TetR/AcrR family transcriptional regulator [Micromonospora sp. WMMD1102]